MNSEQGGTFYGIAAEPFRGLSLTGRMKQLEKEYTGTMQKGAMICRYTSPGSITCGKIAN